MDFSEGINNPQMEPGQVTYRNGTGQGFSAPLLIAVVLITVVALGIYYLYQTNRSISKRATSQSQLIPTSTGATTNTSSSSAKTEVSDQDVDKDFTALDNDLSAIDSGLNDQQKDLSE